jgi:hypothetical protein
MGNVQRVRGELGVDLTVLCEPSDYSSVNIADLTAEFDNEIRLAKDEWKSIDKELMARGARVAIALIGLYLAVEPSGLMALFIQVRAESMSGFE